MPFMLGVCFLCPSMDCLWHKYHYCPSCNEKVWFVIFLNLFHEFAICPFLRKVCFCLFARLLILRSPISVLWWILHITYKGALPCLRDVMRLVLLPTYAISIYCLQTLNNRKFPHIYIHVLVRLWECICCNKLLSWVLYINHHLSTLEFYKIFFWCIFCL